MMLELLYSTGPRQLAWGQPRPATPPPGETPGAPFGASPVPFGTGVARPLRTPGGNRGAPPRGVDVKPPRGQGPGRPRRGPKSLKNGHFGHFWLKCPFLGILPILPPFCPFWANPGAFQKGFYINPSRRGPAVPQNGVLRGIPGKCPKRAIFGDFAQNGQKGGFWGPRALGGLLDPGGGPRYRGGPEGPPRAPGSGDPSRGSRGSHPRPVQGRTHRTACPGRVCPQGSISGVER